MINYDKISLMNIKELAKFMSDIMYCKGCFLAPKCKDCCSRVVEQWLLSEVEDVNI